MAEYRGSLIGVDLSRRMLRESQARGIYDELIPAEVVEELERRTDELNLIVAADVLVYLGDLQRLFAAAATALRVGGILIFSVETTPEADFQLLPTLRYAHSTDYLHRLASSNRLAVRATKNVVLRLEQGADVHGYLMLAEKVP
jgi:predicted TPR repeat methyltransferase